MIDFEIKKEIGDFSLDLKVKTDKKVLGILGQSGSGKTMVLNCIAGLMDPDQGHIKIGKEYFNGATSYSMPVGQRKVGYLFQSYGLFPHMSAEKNISFVNSNKEQTRKLLERVGLYSKRKLYPRSLSGGEKQRLAMARMLAIRPEIILLDEPFSALDSVLRLEMESFIKNIIRELDIATILVSHNKEEIYRLCDDVLIIKEGRLIDKGPKEKVFFSPKDAYSARLVGFENIIGPDLAKDLKFSGKSKKPPANSNLAIKGRDLKIIPGQGFSLIDCLDELDSRTYTLKHKASGQLIRASSEKDLGEIREVSLLVKNFVCLA